MICTFYSFKGGVGRSMALANIAELLYQKGFRVLAIDFDLEAPGLDRYFSRIKDLIPERGLLDLILSYKELASMAEVSGEAGKELRPTQEAEIQSQFVESLSNFVVAIHDSKDNVGSLSIIPAGKRDGKNFLNYSKSVRNFDWSDFYNKWNGERFFEWLRREAEAISDIVLIDSRTGMTEMGGVCTHQLADVVIIFTAPNQQNLDGILMLAKSLSNQNLIQKRNDRDISMIFVPSRIDRSEADLQNNFANLFETSIEPFLSQRLRSEKRVFDEMKIPYIPYYSYMEHVAACDIRSSASDLKDAYERLVDAISKVAPTTSIVSKLYSRIWNVPYLRNPNFMGRKDSLEDVHNSLLSGEPASRTVVISGMGGVGKTQLAVEYTYRFKADYKIIWWVRSEEPAILNSDYADLIKGLDLPDIIQDNIHSNVIAVKRWLENNSGWLLIFDNAQDLDLIDDYLPRGGNGHVIITSRNPNWGSHARILLLDNFSRNESIEFIKSRTKKEDFNAAQEMAMELGDLPLALEQASAYIVETGISLQDYLHLFEDKMAKVLERGKPTDYAEPLLNTWDISFNQIRSKSPEGARLLCLCAYLASDGIPRSLLVQGLELLAPSLSSDDKLDFNDAIACLRDYSLLNVSESNFSINRLIQSMIRNQLNEDDQKLFSSTALKIVNDAFNFDSANLATWEESSKLLPHALATAGFAEELKVNLEAVTRLLSAAGLYLKEMAELTESESVLRRALMISERLYGPNHQYVATMANNLGDVLRDLGKLEEARSLFERALLIDEKVYGPDHPSVATRANNLGSVLRDLGDLQGARKLLERALLIDEKIYGPDHPSVATMANNLGSVLQDLGDPQEARKCFERALLVDEKIYGSDHPSVATMANNLGSVLQDLGDLQEARKCFERALSIDEKVYGPDHPNAARDVNNIGLVMKALGDLQGAKRCFERALRIDERVYGSSHPNVAIRVNNLGGVLQAMGDIEGARTCFERALQIDEKVYGPDHLNVGIRLNNLGFVLSELKNLSEAENYFERSLLILKDILGNMHPSTKTVEYNLNSIRHP